MVLYGTGKDVKKNFALWLISQLELGKQVNVVDDQIGNVTMVDDLAYAALKVTEKDISGIFNLAGNDILSRYEFALKLCDVFSFNKDLVNPIKTSSLHQPAPRPLKSGFTTYKAESELGFKTMDSLEGLRLLKYQLGY
jgi:dTDP-4-dehydrorhamnose reductase